MDYKNTSWKNKIIRAEKTATEVFKFGKNSEHLPEKILNDDVEKGIKILELLVDYKIISSKSEVRRAIKNNGIKLMTCW